MSTTSFDYRKHEADLEKLRRRHNTIITGNVTWSWSCSCGKSGIPTTEGRARAGHDRHLQAAFRRIQKETQIP